MRFLLLTLAFLFSFQLSTSDEETLNWINENAIEIEDTDPDSELVEFGKSAPEKFQKAKLFGFGEATHNSKEFFDLKAKYFKYLVKNQGVKTFIMEDAYQAEEGINEWISGGEGDIKTIANNFLIGFWYSKEIVNLLAWMREYNSDKSSKDQIRFYGMDMQYGKRLNEKIRSFVSENGLDVNEDLLNAADQCAEKMIDPSQSSGWADSKEPQLRKIQQSIKSYGDSNPEAVMETKSALRSLNYLIQYTKYVQDTETELRDSSMFENVKWIAQNHSDNGKAFIWAHNEHINKAEMYYVGSGIINLGSRLKDFYKDDYYSVGFDFGGGELRGYVQEKKGTGSWKNYYVEEPIKKTYAETLFEADKEVFFLDMDHALNNDPTGFFSTKNRNILVAAGGYQPKPLHKVMVNKIYTDFYDGLIFIKKVTIPEFSN
mgnify:CR=1 FL=1